MIEDKSSMMGNKEKIRKAFLAIMKDAKKMCCHWATCKSVDISNQVCVITINELDIPNISLGTSKAGVVLYPTVGADVLVLFEDQSINGRVIDATATNSIELMGNANGGIPIAANVVSKLNILENDINELKIAFAAIAAAGTASPGTPVTNGTLAAVLAEYPVILLTETVNADIENTKVNHGNG